MELANLIPSPFSPTRYWEKSARPISPAVPNTYLKHASVGFTMDVYSHIIEGMQQDAMALLDEVLPSGVCQEKCYKSVTIPDIMLSNN